MIPKKYDLDIAAFIRDMLSVKDLYFLKQTPTRDTLACYMSHMFNKKYSKKVWDERIYPQYLDKIKEIKDSGLIYTGIGSRDTPGDVLESMESISNFLQDEGFILRSGGADGADSAFERGSGNLKEIYIPWKGFNNNKSPYDSISKEAMSLAGELHPNWDKLSEGAKRLHSRNCYQILGENLNKTSLFVICYTKGGKGTGGTGQALRLAKKYNIPIIDYGAYSSIAEAEDAITNCVKQFKWNKNGKH